VVGQENDGWRVCQATLASERGVIAFESAERRRYAVEKYYQDAVMADAPWLQDDQYRREFVGLLAELQASRRLIRQLLRESEDGHNGGPSITPALVKLSSSALRKRIGSFMVKAEGFEGQRFTLGGDEEIDEPMFEYLSSFGNLIAAGSNEIMRNIIAERGLQMPRG
jgi:alkylation response protein AidB-like acyl-CoA dehydrogenase